MRIQIWKQFAEISLKKERADVAVEVVLPALVGGVLETVATEKVVLIKRTEADENTFGGCQVQIAK